MRFRIPLRNVRSLRYVMYDTIPKSAGYLMQGRAERKYPKVSLLTKRLELRGVREAEGAVFQAACDPY